MNNPFANASILLGQYKDLWVRMLGEPVNKTLAALQAVISDSRLQILVFGSYNAGKSTLINALLGEALAPTNDIPTTFCIDRYDWEGHVLLDSPGVNAPIEHEQVTAAILSRVDLVVFVISDEDQDSRDIYTRLVALLREGKKVFLVINPRNPDPTVMAQIHARTNQLLLAEVTAAGLSDSILAELPVVMVKARSALNARLNQQPVLLASSGLDDFMAAFRIWLNNYNTDHNRLDALRRQIHSQLLQPALDYINQKTGNDVSPEADAVAHALATLETQESLLRLSSRQKISQLVNVSSEDISQAVLVALNGENAVPAIQAVASTVSRSLELWLYDEISSNSGVVLEGTADYEKLEDALAQLNTSGGLDKLQNFNRIIRNIDFKMIEPLLKNIKWLQPVLKHAKKLGPFVTIALTVLDVVQENIAEQQKNNQERQRELLLRQQTSALATSLEDSLAASVTEVITALYAGEKLILSNRQMVLQQSLQGLAADRQMLMYVEREVNALSTTG